MPAPITTNRRALKAAAPVFAGLVLLGACSKKDDTTSTTPTTAASSSSGGGSTTAKPSGDKTTTTEGGSTGTTSKTSGSTPGTAKKGTSVGDQTVWYKGFKITLSPMKTQPDANLLTFDATIENLGTENSPIYGDYSLEADGAVYGTGGWKDGAQVLGGAKTKDTLQFSIDEKFDAKATTLVMGNATQDQVRIPLDGSDKVVTLQPQPQEYKGAIKLGSIDYDVSKSEVRYDRIDTHEQADKDRAYLVLYATAKNSSADQTLYIDPSKFEISLPDETKSTTEKYDGETSLSATQKDEKTKMYFVIKAPFAGNYTIAFSGPWGTDGASVSATAKITVKLGGSASGSTTGTTAKK